jgi:hypothetical protein
VRKELQCFFVHAEFSGGRRKPREGGRLRIGIHVSAPYRIDVMETPPLYGFALFPHVGVPNDLSFVIAIFRVIEGGGLASLSADLLPKSTT